MNAMSTKTLRQSFPLSAFIAILAFVILMSVILMSLRSILDKSDQDDVLRSGYEPVMLPELSRIDATSGGPEQDVIFLPDLGMSLYLAKKALKEGDLVKAEDILRSLLLFFPGSPTTEKLLATVFYLTGRYADAERLYRDLLARSPSDAVSLNNLAISQGNQGHFADAIANMKTVLEMAPESATPDLNLAALYWKSGNRTLARKHFESARKKLHGDFRNLTFDPSLKELLMESDIHGQIVPLPDGGENGSDEMPEPEP